MTARFLRAIVTVVALFVAMPAAAAPANVDSVVFVAATEERPAPPALRARRARKPIRKPLRTRMSRPAERRTLGDHAMRIARVMMIAAAAIGPAPPPPPLPEPAKIEQVAEDSNGDEED